jgi:hypothetical protein
MFIWSETDAIAAVTPMVDRDIADWQLFVPVFNDILERYTADGAPAGNWWELFRNAGNELCVSGWSVLDSAFDHEWIRNRFYGNVVYEHTFLYRTLDKTLTDFRKSPSDT